MISSIQPLQNLNADKLKDAMYAIPATQMLHKIMFHETSIAKQQQNEPQRGDDVFSDEQQRSVYDKQTHSVLNYIASNQISSSLGTSLLCHESVTLKELQIEFDEQMKSKQMTLNPKSNRPDSQCLLTICHRIVKSHRSTSVQSIAFLVIDVDSFYQINEQFGTQIGDLLLKQIAETLFDTIQSIQTQSDRDSEDCAEFYHPSNNRFYVLISVKSEEEALNFGSLIVNTMRNRTFEVNGTQIKRTVSVSVYLYNPSLSVNNILSNAHIPLFHCKHHGKNQVVSYNQVRREKKAKISKEQRKNIWSKQMFDMIGVYGKYSEHFCKRMSKRFVSRKDVDINWQNKKDANNTILMYCIENGCRELVDFYLKHFLNKLDFNILRDDGSNALLLAIKYDFKQNVVEKIMWKTDTKNRNITNKWMDNTVQMAQMKGMHQIINSLKI